MSFPARVRPPTPTRFFLTFGYAWLTIGLFTGTIVLVVLVRAILGLIQRLGWGQDAQNRILMVLILAFIVVSFMLARRLVRVLYRKSVGARRATLAALALPAVASLYAWSNPTKFLAGVAGTTSTSLSMSNGGPTFIFGSYPDDARLRQLKEQGVETVISLQDPRVIVELQGISEERKSAERIGLKLVQAPMLPWVSDNSASIALLKDIALHGKGTYYIHCGLGRDRVNIARRVIESLEPATHARLAAAGVHHAVGFESRTEPFERGRLVRLADEAWLVPYPNAAEFYGFIVQGSPGHVVLALDPADTLQARWIAQGTRDMRQYAVSFTLMPRRAADTSAAAIAPIVARIRALPRPVTVLVPKTTWDSLPPRDALSRALVKAFARDTAASPKVATRP